MPDEGEVCCILGICCRRGSPKHVKAVGRLSASDVATEYQLVPLALLEERKDLAEMLDRELRGYLKRRGVEIPANAEE